MEKLKYILLIERSQCENATYNDFNCDILETIKKKSMKAVKKSGIARSWKEGLINRWSTKNYQGSENTLYDIIMMNIWNHIFVKAHRIYNTKSET